MTWSILLLISFSFAKVRINEIPKGFSGTCAPSLNTGDVDADHWFTFANGDKVAVVCGTTGKYTLPASGVWGEFNGGILTKSGEEFSFFFEEASSGKVQVILSEGQKKLIEQLTHATDGATVDLANIASRLMLAGHLQQPCGAVTSWYDDQIRLLREIKEVEVGLLNRDLLHEKDVLLSKRCHDEKSCRLGLCKGDSRIPFAQMLSDFSVGNRILEALRSLKMFVTHEDKIIEP